MIQITMNNNNGMPLGCNLEARVKGGSIQKLDRVHGHCECVTCCQPGLNLKVGKMNYHLDPIWAKCSKSGQKNLFIALLSLFTLIVIIVHCHCYPCSLFIVHCSHCALFL